MWEWPWRLLDVLLLALDDCRNSGKVTSFVGDYPLSVVISVVLDQESVTTDVVDCFCPIWWR